MNENKELMVANSADVAGAGMLSAFQNTETSVFASIKDDGSRESKVAIFNAVNAPNEKLDDHKGEVLAIRDVVAHPISLVDENTGELVNALRCVLIAEDGTGYEAVSMGIASSLQKIFAIVGQPTWEPALKLKVVEQKTRKGFKTNTIELV